MKLTELNAKFWAHGDGRHGQGIVFHHPGCNCTDKTVYGCIAVPFENPVDGGPKSEGYNVYWTRTGDTIETLSVTPSINVLSDPKWHGWIRNGEAMTC